MPLSTVTIVRHFTYGHYTPRTEVRKENDKKSRREWGEGWQPHTILINDMPGYLHWRDLLGNPNFIADTMASETKITVGLSITHPSDCFSRKEGLRLASERMIELTLRTRDVVVDSTSDIVVSFVASSNLCFTVRFGRGGRTILESVPSYRDLYNYLYGTEMNK